MTRIFFRRRMPLLFVLTLLLVSFACKFFTGGPEADVPAAGAPTPEESITVEDLVFGPGEFILPDTKAGLADLNSYKATLMISFDGTRAGKTEQWSKTYVMLTSKEPGESQLTIEKTGDLSDLDAVFMAEMNGADYERIGGKSCTAIMLEQGNSLGERLELAGFLTGVRGAEAAGSETVNDVAANHYTFDERSFGQLDIADSTGEMWVASDGGYIVKYLLTTKGNADYFGEGLEGTLTLDYQLTDINGPITVTLPDNCPAGLVNAPTLTDASDILNMPGLLTYQTSTSLADAASFYQQEIPNLGWELTGEPTITDTTALLDFTQGTQTMVIFITTSDTGTTIHMVLGDSQK